jgi:pyruvate kinase
LTAKDKEDLKFAIEQDVDFTAFSFVSNGKEIIEIRELMNEMKYDDGNLPQIVSKIERKEAIENIDEIISASDVIMVARGDLGIELDESKVVIYQKEIIAKCLKAVKPVIVATQMMDSMIENPIPTRAEVSDVSNAVIDHTDAVMLSGESASGKYPVQAVVMMNQIIKNTETSRFDDMRICEVKGKSSDYASVISSACQLAKNQEIQATVVFSESGYTARLISNHRTNQPVIVSTNNKKTYYQLAIVWGVEPYLFPKEDDRHKLIELVIDKSKKEKILKKGDKIIVLIGEKAKEAKASLVGIKEVG